MKYLVTGAAGFIGSCFVRELIGKSDRHKVIAVDCLSYAGDLTRLDSVSDSDRFTFAQADISSREQVSPLMKGVECVINFAAESHVDRSLFDTEGFFRTNCTGTQVLLDEAVRSGVKRFVQVSTDEVYGSIQDGFFKEGDPLNPTNPYSVSKAAAEWLVINAFRQDGLDVVITRGANTYGPFQYPEKLIPFFISQALQDEMLPLYGDGKQERDWLHVEDHARAVLYVAEKGEPGEIYNIEGSGQKVNIDVARKILSFLGKPESLIKYVEDRKGHDRRYAMCDKKLRSLGFEPLHSFDESIEGVLSWYVKHSDWIRAIQNKDSGFSDFKKSQYEARLKEGR